MFDEILKYAKTVSDNIKKVNDIAIEAELPNMVRLNWKQLDQGKKNDGNNIVPSYSPNYARKKGFNSPDLKVTGDFRQSIEIDYRGDSLVFGASDRKTPHLIEKYTENILGLTDENAKISFEKIEGKVYDYINRQADKFL